MYGATSRYWLGDGRSVHAAAMTPRPSRGPRRGQLPVGVAAHHPVTADAAAEVLADGGTAGDAAVAAVFASCVAESLLTSLWSGGHGIYWDAEARAVQLVDFFVTIPGLGDDRRAGSSVAIGPPRTVDIVFESEPVPYEIGCAAAGVPGLPAGCSLLWERWGRLPWQRLLEPARAAALAGVAMLPTHVNLLRLLWPVFQLDRGGELFAPGGRPLERGEVLHQPGIRHALDVLADEGAVSCYRGTLADDLLALCRERGGLIEREDLEAYRVEVSQPEGTTYAGVDVRSRRGLSALLRTLASLRDLNGLSAADRSVALAEALGGDAAPGDTTNVAVVDAAGNACAVTTSLGLGTGDWLHDSMLNSMLGERDLRRGEPVPGHRMGSMMAPTMAFDADGPLLVAGAAGGSRITSAMTQVVAGVLAEGRTVADAIERPRLHRIDRVVLVEPDFEDEGEAALVEAGYDVRRFSTRHHFFGGVSGIGRAGAGADSRRDGAVRDIP